MAAYALDVFDLLGKIDNPKSGDIYKSLSEAEQKGFAPLVVMRWMSGTSDEQQIMLLNEFANPSIFTLGKHPHLLMLLLQASSSKTKKHYQWLSVKAKKKNPITLAVIKEYFGMSSREVSLMSLLPTNEEIIRMAEDIGYQKDEIKKLEKELSPK